MSGHIRRGYELKTLFFGRPVRPFHLAVALATFAIGYNLLFRTCHCGWSGPAAHFLGSAALLAAALLFAGWWFKSDRAAEWGLLLATGVWAARTAFVLLSTNEQGLLNNPVLSSLLSIAWMIGAGGAYLLERYDRMTEEGDGE